MVTPEIIQTWLICLNYAICSYCKDSHKPYFEALCNECYKYVNDFEWRLAFGEDYDSKFKLNYCIDCIKKNEKESKMI